ncbi:uncharacterized protein CCOS01_15796 [Colletotrichum costaricense]|uniref:Uncharacterized protein n=1 Tax=Colletotrichum costaricense TaxID=1209916 RepID=A0AAJ0DT37_9PEZI|nr:uncharacterized protein CCOS01_15796 [Colletotrichum costaricense]KAK1509280.1 hypothetical protein CCOS01_15796 [Colletotrichum costaricense]
MRSTCVPPAPPTATKAVTPHCRNAVPRTHALPSPTSSLSLHSLPPGLCACSEPKRDILPPQKKGRLSVILNLSHAIPVRNTETPKHTPQQPETSFLPSSQEKPPSSLFNYFGQRQLFNKRQKQIPSFSVPRPLPPAAAFGPGTDRTDSHIPRHRTPQGTLRSPRRPSLSSSPPYP